MGSNAWIRWLATHSPAACPRCGARRVVPIVYGLRDGDAEAQGLVRLGGALDASSPAWNCLACGGSGGSALEVRLRAEPSGS